MRIISESWPSPHRFYCWFCGLPLFQVATWHRESSGCSQELWVHEHLVPCYHHFCDLTETIETCPTLPFSIRMKNIEKKRCWNQFKTNKNSTPWGNTKLVKTTLLPFVFIYHSFSKSNFPKQYWITTVWDFSFRTMLPRRLTYCIQLSLLPLVFDLETKSHFMF